MINVVIPIVNNAKKYSKIISDLSSIDDINVFVGVTTEQFKFVEEFQSENVFVIEYKDGSKREEIINSLQKYISGGDLFIMRKPITISEFEKFVNSESDITLSKPKRSNFKQFLMSIWQNILKTFLGVKLYNGDTSAIYFQEDIASVVLQSSNLSYSTRVDRWNGVSQGNVEISGESVKTESDKKLNIKYLIIGILALIIGTVVTAVVSVFASVSIIVGLLLFCLDAIMLSIFLILLIIITFNSMVGKKHFGSAIEVLKDEDFEEDENFEEDNDEDVIEINQDDV